MFQSRVLVLCVCMCVCIFVCCVVCLIIHETQNIDFLGRAAAIRFPMNSVCVYIYINLNPKT